jgi:hypothetical protein
MQIDWPIFANLTIVRVLTIVSKQATAWAVMHIDGRLDKKGQNICTAGSFNLLTWLSV